MNHTERNDNVHLMDYNLLRNVPSELLKELKEKSYGGKIKGKVNICLNVFFKCLLLPHCLTMDADNGDGNLIRDLPCIMRLNQLSCTGSGNSFPKKSISFFIDDNKALLRRMYGELQEARTVIKPTLTLVRSFGHTR